jgi:hypothetical protein
MTWDKPKKKKVKKNHKTHGSINDEILKKK